MTENEKLLKDLQSQFATFTEKYSEASLALTDARNQLAEADHYMRYMSETAVAMMANVARLQEQINQP